MSKENRKASKEEREAAKFIAYLPEAELLDTIIELGREADSAKARLTIFELAFKYTKDKLEEAERQRDAYKAALETVDEVLSGTCDSLELAKAISASRLSVKP